MSRIEAHQLRLYLVTDTGLCGKAGVVHTVQQAVAAGVAMVQLRDPDASDDEFVAMGLALAGVLRGTGVPLIVNDRVHLARQVGADGVHVGQTDMSVRKAREVVGPDAIVGLSVQTEDHVATCIAHDDDVDYLGAGPIWPTTSKPDAAVPSGQSTLEALVQLSHVPVVAIGGINASRVAAVRASGAAGSAVVSAICGQPDVADATRRLVHAWEETP